MVAGPFLGRVRCHCTICQAANQAPYADSTILLAKHVPLGRVENVRFDTMKEPPALQRGFCRSCGCFVVAYGDYWRFLSLAFVPAARYPGAVPLPEPSMHVFYASRIADVADALPKNQAFQKSGGGRGGRGGADGETAGGGGRGGGGGSQRDPDRRRPRRNDTD